LRGGKFNNISIVFVGMNDNDKFNVYSFDEYLKGYNGICFPWKSF